MAEILAALKQASGIIKIFTLLAKLFPSSEKTSPDVAKAVNLVEKYAAQCAKWINSNQVALMDGYDYLHEPGAFHDSLPPIDAIIAEMPPNSPPELLNYVHGVTTLIENKKANEEIENHPDILIHRGNHEIEYINNELGHLGYTALLQAELVRNKYRLPNPNKLLLKNMINYLKRHSKEYRRRISPVRNWLHPKWKSFCRWWRSHGPLTLLNRSKRCR